MRSRLGLLTLVVLRLVFDFVVRLLVPELRFLVVFFIVVCLPVAAELVVAAGFVIVGIKKLLALKKIKRLFLLFRELYSIILFFDEKFKSYKKKRV